MNSLCISTGLVANPHPIPSKEVSEGCQQGLILACMTSFGGSQFPVYCADALRVCERLRKHCTCDPNPGMYRAYTTYVVNQSGRRNHTSYNTRGPSGYLMASLLQVSFAFSSPLVWDKAPNSFGQKVVVVDPTAVVVEEEEDWLVIAASVGSHLIRLAIAQRIIEYEDLEGCAIGKVFKLSDLVKRQGDRPRPADAPTPRPSPVGDLVDEMCEILSVVM